MQELDPEATAKKYIKLAYSVAWEWCKKGAINYEEVLEVAHMALAKALRGYRPDKAEFATYLYTIATNEVLMLLRYKSRAARYGFRLISLDAPVRNVKDGSETLLHEVVVDDHINMEEELIEFENKVEAYETLSTVVVEDVRKRGKLTKTLKCFLYWLKGYTQRQIAELLGTNQAFVSRSIACVRRKLRERYRELHSEKR